MMSLKRRVGVTGLGLVTPLGIGVEETWKALCAGQSGVDRISRFDAAGYPVRIAAEVKGFDPTLYMEKKEVKKMDTFIHYALAAGLMSMEDARYKVPLEAADRIGVYVGSGIGGLQAIEVWHKVLLEKGPRRVTPFFIP